MTTRILITSGGGPGVWGLLFALRRLPGRRVTLLVHDPASTPTLGTALADECVRLPFAHDPAYLPALLAHCRRESVDVLIPVYDGELLQIAQRRADFESAGTRVLLPPTNVVAVCVDKGRTYARLQHTGFLPPSTFVTTPAATAEAIKLLGYPQRRVCVKPVDRAGGRGLHILSAQTPTFEERMSAKPGPACCTAEEFLAWRGRDPEPFPLVIGEYLEGEEIGVDLLADDGRVLGMVARRKSGASLHGNPSLIAFEERAGERTWVERLTAEMRLSGLLAIDARYDAHRNLKLLEINARPGAYIGMSCTRLHLLAWAIDRLLDDRVCVASEYVGNESIRCGLRAFADVVLGAGQPHPLDVSAPTEEDPPHARLVSRRASR